MKEHPIIFSGEMVRVILKGCKTQTRRPMKPQPPEWIERFGYTCFTPKGSISGRGTFGEAGPAEKFYKRPFNPGDRLWVRETFCDAPIQWHGGPTSLVLKADQTDLETTRSIMDRHGVKWKPSIHMPRELSRITLEVTSVHVERVNEISDAAAIAEGADGYLSRHGWKRDPSDPSKKWTPREEFEALWENIYGNGSFERGDWVWVVSFFHWINKR